MRKIKVVVLLVRQLQHGFTKNAKVSPNLTVTHIWAIPAETTILVPSKHDIGPWHILFLQIFFFLHDSGQVYLP